LRKETALRSSAWLARSFHYYLKEAEREGMDRICVDQNRTMAGCFENCDELSVFVKFWDFFFVKFATTYFRDAFSFMDFVNLINFNIGFTEVTGS
jgi:hypothetical protein